MKSPLFRFLMKYKPLGTSALAVTVNTLIIPATSANVNSKLTIFRGNFNFIVQFFLSSYFLHAWLSVIVTHT